MITGVYSTGSEYSFGNLFIMPLGYHFFRVLVLFYARKSSHYLDHVTAKNSSCNHLYPSCNQPPFSYQSPIIQEAAKKSPWKIECFLED